jgi:hypothetical protein
MTDIGARLLEIEIYPDEASAIRALQGNEAAKFCQPLPEEAHLLGAKDVGSVTVIRVDDEAIKAQRMGQGRGIGPGQFYFQLVKEYSRDRLVMNFADVSSFGLQFNSDMFRIFFALTQVGGRIGLCNVGEWYLAVLRCNRLRLIRAGMKSVLP